MYFTFPTQHAINFNRLALGAIVLLLIVLSAGCSGPRGVSTQGPLPDGFPNHSVDQILQAMNANPAGIDAYLSESSLAVKSPIQSGSFSASITHKKNDSLLIAISPGLGIVAVKALITTDSFYVHDRINKELGIGTIQAMQRMLPLPADAVSLYNALLGQWTPDTATAWELTADKSYYIFSDPPTHRTFYIDPSLWKVVRYVEQDAAGQLVEERTFGEFDDFDGMYLPRRLTFRRPVDDTSASLYHRKLSLNPSALDFDFSVSSSVRRVNF